MEALLGSDDIVDIKSEPKNEPPWDSFVAIPFIHPAEYSYSRDEPTFFQDSHGPQAHESVLYQQTFSQSYPLYQPASTHETRRSIQSPSYVGVQYPGPSAETHSSTSQDRMQEMSAQSTVDPRTILLGDFSIATQDIDEGLAPMFDAFDSSSIDSYHNDLDIHWHRITASTGHQSTSSSESREMQDNRSTTAATSIEDHDDDYEETIQGYTQRAGDVARWRSTDGRTPVVATTPPVARSQSPSRSVRPSRAQTRRKNARPSRKQPISARRTSTDDYLLNMRKQGLSYKEIKRMGKFKEAESTLRGRVRTLTKAKEDRVRKPVWTPDDINLLHVAVNRHLSYDAYDTPHTSPRYPWKKIAEWLANHGASYMFASATCAKKWAELKAQGN